MATPLPASVALLLFMNPGCFTITAPTKNAVASDAAYMSVRAREEDRGAAAGDLGPFGRRKDSSSICASWTAPALFPFFDLYGRTCQRRNWRWANHITW